jgi:hypothetical protein
VRKEQQYDTINKLLMEWNPIGVVGPALEDEYRSYVPRIFERREHLEELTVYLQELLGELGLEFDSDNDLQVKELENLALRIVKSVAS